MSGFLISNMEHFTLKLTEIGSFEKSKMAAIHLKLKVHLKKGVSGHFYGIRGTFLPPELRSLFNSNMSICRGLLKGKGRLFRRALFFLKRAFWGTFMALGAIICSLS